MSRDEHDLPEPRLSLAELYGEVYDELLAEGPRECREPDCDGECLRCER